MPMLTKELFKKQKYIIPLFDVLQYSGFSNQPNDDEVEVVSNNAADTQLCTIWGTDTSDNYQYETVTLKGQTAVKTTKKWKTVVGVFLGDVYGKNSVAATGTITIREASGDAQITTISATKRSTGNIRFLIRGLNITIFNASGNLYYNTIEWPTADNSMTLTAKEKGYIRVEDYITFHSDGTGAAVQIMVWED
jgi:hypothetical protein